MVLLAVPQLHRQDRRHQRERRRVGADQRPVADRKPIDEPKYNTQRECTGRRQRQSASLLFADHFDRLWQPAQRREDGTDAADEIDKGAECHTSAIRLIRLLHMTILLPTGAASVGSVSCPRRHRALLAARRLAEAAPARRARCRDVSRTSRPREAVPPRRPSRKTEARCDQELLKNRQAHV